MLSHETYLQPQVLAVEASSVASLSAPASARMAAQEKELKETRESEACTFFALFEESRAERPTGADKKWQTKSPLSLQAKLQFELRRALKEEESWPFGVELLRPTSNPAPSVQGAHGRPCGRHGHADGAPGCCICSFCSFCHRICLCVLANEMRKCTAGVAWGGALQHPGDRRKKKKTKSIFTLLLLPVMMVMMMVGDGGGGGVEAPIDAGAVVVDVDDRHLQQQ